MCAGAPIPRFPLFHTVYQIAFEKLPAGELLKRI